ncbi:hypothetical protein [Pseudofrankia sp. DC12]|nr:hypothetical protein [Pseudofrankia sp. DC12]
MAVSAGSRRREADGQELAGGSGGLGPARRDREVVPEAMRAAVLTE